MLAKIKPHPKPLTESDLSANSYHLVLLQHGDELPSDLLSGERLRTALARRKLTQVDFSKTPIMTETHAGGVVVWARFDPNSSRFVQMDQLRLAVMLLLAESPKSIGIAAFGDAGFCGKALRTALYVCGVNVAKLPNVKTGTTAQACRHIDVLGVPVGEKFVLEQALISANYLCRSLTAMPGNQLTPAIYQLKISKLAKRHAWNMEVYDQKKLKNMGAGAFLAVAQGSADKDAVVIHLRRHVAQAKQTVALVGKGICFDTGGHQIKPAKYMQGMHEDMAGSAVALSILQAVTELTLPVNIDVWLAIAQNHIGPNAYKPGDVVHALNGTSIEMVHTDAEGRLVLADTLSLAAQNKPDVMVDFATLTGSMITALGNRYSGVLGNNPDLLMQALAAGVISGERLCAFPMDDDYAPALDSKVADIKQCLLEGDADHILAACFLKRFVADTPWLHMDLSASNRPDGLGAVSTDVTGFGVAWGVTWLQSLLDQSV